MARLKNDRGEDFARRHLRWLDQQDDLTSLSIEGFALGPAFLDEVLARLAPAGVVHLHLLEARLGAAGARRLAASPGLRRLETLDLHGGGIGDDGAIALAGSAQLAQVRRLLLPHNRIGDAGALALARAPHLAGLAELALADNRIGEAARGILVARFGAPALPHLDHQRLDRLGGAHLDDAYLGAEVRWRATWSRRVPYQAEVDGAIWVLRAGAGLDDPAYILYVDGVELGEIDEWPAAWQRPPRITLRVELVAWARELETV